MLNYFTKVFIIYDLEILSMNKYGLYITRQYIVISATVHAKYLFEISSDIKLVLKFLVTRKTIYMNGSYVFNLYVWHIF